MLKVAAALAREYASIKYQDGQYCLIGDDGRFHGSVSYVGPHPAEHAYTELKAMAERKGLVLR